MNYKLSTIFMPILREVLGTGRKIVTLSFTEEKLCVMFGSTNFHLLIPLHDSNIIHHVKVTFE